jgi:hypothetical protein
MITFILLELFCLQQIQINIVVGWLLFVKHMTDAYNFRVEKICLDNSSENVDMTELIHAEGYNVTYVFMSPGAPQYHDVAERMFATLYGWCVLCSVKHIFVVASWKTLL